MQRPGVLRRRCRAAGRPGLGHEGFRLAADQGPVQLGVRLIRPGREGNHSPALVVVHEDGSSESYSFAQLLERSLGITSQLRSLEVSKGDSVLVMLGNQVELWESMLGAIRLGAVVMPTTTAVGPADLADRI